ncbi:hypothetical protein D3C86_2054100 [compost metagenome]
MAWKRPGTRVSNSVRASCSLRILVTCATPCGARPMLNQATNNATSKAGAMV